MTLPPKAYLSSPIRQYGRLTSRASLDVCSENSNWHRRWLCISLSVFHRNMMCLPESNRRFTSNAFSSASLRFVKGILVLVAVLSAFFSGMLQARSPIFYESEPIQREIDANKAILETLTLSASNAASWTIGYASSWDDPPESPLTLEIKFAKDEVVDLVALFPALYHDTSNVKQSFGFPVRFSLERLLPDGSTEMIANHLDEDYPVHGMGPQLFPCTNPVLTSGLRITVTRRAPNLTWWPTSHVVALSEVFAFVGDRNAALRGKVKASSSYDLKGFWGRACLTDGFSLYSQTNFELRDPTLSFRGFGDEVRLEVDLGRERRIDEVRLWPVVRSIQVNYPLTIGAGFPQAFRVELASHEDFSDAKVICEEKQLTQKVGGGPWMQHAEPTSGRYARITLRDGVRDSFGQERAEIKLGELELLENGREVTSGLRISAPGYETTGLALLNDGFVNEGRILPLREWLTEFHERVALTQELKNLWPVATEARIRDEKRSRTLLLIAIGLIIALIQAVWLVRVAARRRWAQMRERIACDLHDEIGANVSSIAHTAELLKETIHEPSATQSRLLCNLIDSAHLTTKETKHFVRFIESEDQDLDLTEQFAQVANRILGTIPATFSIENTRSFNALDPTTKWNLLLFYKEALNNIIKHAGATAVEVHTRRMGSRLLLKVMDNGRGKSENSGDCRHLESRAKVLGGQLEIRSVPADGTHVTLTFNRNSKP
jgi:signal transduction histidine kinase